MRDRKTIPLLLFFLAGCSTPSGPLPFPEFPDDAVVPSDLGVKDARIDVSAPEDRGFDPRRDPGPGELPTGDGPGEPGCQPDCFNRVCGPDGCGSVCGVCPAGTTCAADRSLCIALSLQKVLGAACGVSDLCRPTLPDPWKPGSAWVNPAWPSCMDDQCLDGRCWRGFCSRECTPRKDTVVNGSGLPGGDGIEDADTPGTDCEGGEPARFPDGYACVVTGQDAAGIGLCHPRSSFAPCTSGKACPKGESCGFLQVLGNVEARCLASPEDGGPLAAPCGFDPVLGSVLACASWSCTNDGCTEACAEAPECLSSGASCTSGACAGSGVSCASDADCSAWTCRPDTEVKEPTAIVSACGPRDCATDRDCRDPGFFCMHRAIEDGSGSLKLVPKCAPRTVGGAPVGAFCDETPGDGLPDTVCANGAYCLEHRCSAMCAADSDCPSGMRCGRRDVPVDLDDNGVSDGHLIVPMCVWVGDAFSPCLTQDDCKAGTCTPWLTAKPDGTLSVETACMEPPPSSVSFGQRCGKAALGQECDTRVCLDDRPDIGIAGWCSLPCVSDLDCPALSAVGPDLVRWICEARLFSGAGTDWRLDDLHVSWCVPVPAISSLAPCAPDLTCAEPAEICRASIRAGAPGTSLSIRYLCVRPTVGALAGETCDPSRNGSDCASGSCAPSSMEAVGFCTVPCGSDSGCAGLAASSCEPRVVIPHADPAFSAIVQECRIHGPCVVCRDDWDCTAGFRCVNVSSVAGIPDFRCGKACLADTECAVAAQELCSPAPASPASEPTGEARVCLPLNCEPL